MIESRGGYEGGRWRDIEMPFRSLTSGVVECVI